MSQYNISNAKTKTQNANDNYWASDDVHRIAMRRPALYRMNIVPQIDRSQLPHIEEGDMS